MMSVGNGWLCCCGPVVHHPDSIACTACGMRRDRHFEYARLIFADSHLAVPFAATAPLTRETLFLQRRGMLEALNALGAEGWEVIGMHMSDFTTAVLKREKPHDPPRAWAPGGAEARFATFAGTPREGSRAMYLKFPGKIAVAATKTALIISGTANIRPRVPYYSCSTDGAPTSDQGLDFQNPARFGPRDDHRGHPQELGPLGRRPDLHGGRRQQRHD